MPIVLVDRREPMALSFGDATVSVIPAASDRVLAEIRRGLRKSIGTPDESEAAGAEAAIRLCAECILDWAGVLDAKGTAIPWPAPGAAVGCEGRAVPSRSDLDVRVYLLRAMPWNVLARIDEAIATAWRESSDSGKDSPPGSGG